MGYEGPHGLKQKQGFLFKVTTENVTNPQIVLSSVDISNGLAWNKDNNLFYYIDSPTRQIKEFLYDSRTGDIRFSRVAFDLADHQNLAGVPDGMTIDTEDNLWVALYGGGCIINVDPKEGKLLKVVALPARDVTSAIFGGPYLDILYVTTSRISLTEEERKIYPAAGSVFAVKNLGAKGFPVFQADVRFTKFQDHV